MVGMVGMVVGYVCKHMPCVQVCVNTCAREHVCINVSEDVCIRVSVDVRMCDKG